MTMFIMGQGCVLAFARNEFHLRTGGPFVKYLCRRRCPTNRTPQTSKPLKIKP